MGRENDMQGKVFALTGGASGIGLATGKRRKEEKCRCSGWRVVDTSDYINPPYQPKSSMLAAPA